MNSESQIPLDLDQILVNGLLEVFGQDELYALSSSAGMPIHPVENGRMDLEQKIRSEDILSFQTVLIGRFGFLGTQGLAVRTGRAFFVEMFRHYDEQLGFQEIQYRRLMKTRRIQAGMEKLADGLGGACRQEVHVSDLGEEWAVSVPLGVDQTELASATAYFITGFLQEFLAWESGGKVFRITPRGGEGAPGCEVRIGKKVID